MAPPLSGGEHEEILEKLQKPEIGWLPPKHKKVPPQNTMAPPLSGGEFWGGVAPPQGFWGGGECPPQTGWLPPVRGGLNTPKVGYSWAPLSQNIGSLK